ncbi:soma ferritin-like [Olea europaea subsp. europaea]|uniref:Ferritin n=1 Tax=Olea europaea subsp. europaea TaxID=158383 RepID=A0A8S0TSG9_OLEEU|nr:soma ferritin-like [Olea europaea subsp. europaea]
MSPALKFTLVLVCASLASFSLSTQADDNGNSALQDYYLIHNDCLNALNEQISWELYASIVYLNMAAYFDRPSVAHHGYAKFFRDQSLEEYNHAGKFIDYINTRNGTVKRISIDESPKNEWFSPREALLDAIKLEKHVYAKIQYIHDVADQKCQDSHLTDFLESYYFIEQVDSIKELQTMLTKIDLADPTASAVIVHITDEKLKKSKEDL